MRILNRLVFAVLIVLGALWVGSYGIELRNRATDRAFYEERVAPMMKRGPEGFDGPLMSEWLDRNQRRREQQWFRTKLFLGAGALVMGWSVLMLIFNERAWRRRNAAARPADPEAGSVLREARNEGSILVACTARRGLHFLPVSERHVEVDFARHIVVFRGFKFIAAFMGNKCLPEKALPFSEILGGRIWVNHDQQSLNLRTTAGTVTITDSLEPFPQLAAVLFDIIEVNRTDPAAYAAALAREPKIKTPWYGWLIFAAALAAVGGLAALLWRLQPK